MQGQEVLTSIIEVGIGIAGFSSIIVTLSRYKMTEQIKMAFRQLWLQSGVIITFSAIPLIMATTRIDPDSIYVYCSYLYFVILVVGFTFGPVAKRYRQHPILLIVLLFPVLILTNALFLGEAWPYLAVLLAGVLVAFLSFFQMIQYLWNQDQDSKA